MRLNRSMDRLRNDPHIRIWIRVMRLNRFMDGLRDDPHIRIWIRAMRFNRNIDRLRDDPHISVWSGVMRLDWRQSSARIQQSRFVLARCRPGNHGPNGARIHGRGSALIHRYALDLFGNMLVQLVSNLRISNRAPTFVDPGCRDGANHVRRGGDFCCVDDHRRRNDEFVSNTATMMPR